MTNPQCPSCREETLISISSTGLHTCSKCSLGWFPALPAVKILGEDQEPEGPAANIGRCCPGEDLPQLLFPVPPTPHVLIVEDDGSTTDTTDPGAKGDGNRPRVDKGVFGYWPRTLEALARVSERGVDQPGRQWGGHMLVPNGFERYMDAHARHVLKRHLEEIDPQMNEPHVLLIAWNILTACEHYLRDQEKKDAP